MNININPRQLGILQHALGLDQHGQPPKGRVPCSDDDFLGCYRNYYAIGPESPEFHQLRELAKSGLMVDRGAQKLMGGMHVFHVTLKGYEAVKEHSPRPPKESRAKRRWRHYRDVRDVLGISFKEYLHLPCRKESEARAGI